jgi:iron(III) transport system permease protein
MATTAIDSGRALSGLGRRVALGYEESLTTIRREPIKYIVILTAVAALAVLVCYPVYLLFEFSLYDDAGKFTLSNYWAVFTRDGLVSALMNSLILAFFVPLSCLLLGLPMAWFVSRTDMPFKGLVRAFAGIAFIVPSFIAVIAWIFLLAPNSGKINKLLMSLFGLETPPINIFSLEGLIFVESMHFYPLVFFAVTAALDNIDPSYEDAARNLGAGRFRTAVTVTLPLVTPAILSGLILCVLDALAAFGAPAALGFPVNIHVLTTKIYTLLSHPPQLQLAAAVSIPIIFFTALCLLCQKWWIGRTKYTTLTGKIGKAQAVELGRWRWAAFGFCFLVIFFSVLLPLTALVILSLLNTFGADIALKNMVLSNYMIFFDDTFIVWQSVQNSMKLSLATATLCVLLGIVYVWIVERTKIPGRGLVTFIVMITFGFPAVAMGVGILIGYIDWLYGSLWIIFVAYMAKKIPFAFIFMRNAIKQIGEELEEAARIAGATWLRSVRDVTVPLMKTGIWVGWVLIFSLSLRELAMSIFLTQPGTEVMAVAVYIYLEEGAVENAAAISVVIALLSVTTVMIARKIAGKGTLEVG